MTDSITIVTDNTGAAAAALAAMAAYEGANNAAPVAPPVPVPVPVPVPDGNVYPLTMEPAATPGAPVTLGVGPDTLMLQMANNPASEPAAGNGQFAVMVNGVVVAAPLTVTSNAGMAGGQIFTINGNWGPMTTTNPQVELVNVPGSSGISWVDAVTYNFVPLDTNTMSDSRGVASVNAPSAFDSAGVSLIFGPPVPVAPAPVVVTATASVISGVTVNGAAVAAATLKAIIEAAPAGATVLLPAGTFTGATDVLAAMAITGAGMGKTIVTCANLEPDMDKAVFVPTVPGVVITDLTIEGAAISAALGNNAAGVRDSGPGVGFTLTRCEITGCQDGLLTFPSNITLNACDVHGNGAGDGLSHEIYIGGDTTNTATINTTNSTCGPLSTHALKSRAGTLAVTGGVLTGSADPTGSVGGSVIDIPDCGLASFTGTTATLAAGTANTNFITYGSETGLNLAIGKALMLTDFIANDLNGKGGGIAAGAAAVGATLTLAGCTYSGPVAPTFSGWASVTGAFTKATA